MVAEQGFEPRPKAPKTRVLPLHHSARWTASGEDVRCEAALHARLTCRRWDSNPHGSPQRCLRPPRLPFRHFGPFRTGAPSHPGHHTSPVRLTGPPLVRTKGPLSGPFVMMHWSGRRGSNSRPPPWQGGALPLSYFRFRTRVYQSTPLTGNTRRPQSPSSVS